MAMACSISSPLPTLAVQAPIHCKTSSPVAQCSYASNFLGIGVSGKTTITRSVKGASRAHRTSVIAMATAQTALSESKWGPPVKLGTGKLPDDVDLKIFENLLFQWGSSLTLTANLPLPSPLKVDRIEGGVRLGYVEVVGAKCEDLVHIDVVVAPASDEQPKAMFRALRNGKRKDLVPPGEALIMQSLLGALKKAVPLSRPQQ